METSYLDFFASRIKVARQAAGWSQAELARRMGLDGEEAVSRMERGEHDLSVEEIGRLREATGRDLDYFTNPTVLSGEERFSWRVAPGTPEEALDKFEAQAKRLVGVLWCLCDREDLLHDGRDRPTVQLERHSSYEDAWAAAEELALRMDLGPVPAETLAQKAESELGVQVLLVDPTRTYYERNEAGRGISGAACHLPDLDAILLNRHRPPAIRLFNLAHELFHVLTWERMEPAWLEPDSFAAEQERRRGGRVERLADNFAAALLMPAYALDELLDPARAGDLDHLREVAGRLQVAPLMFGWHLFHTGRIDAAARDRLAQLPPQREDSPPPPFSPTFLRLLHEVVYEGEMSGRLAAKGTGLNVFEQGDMFVELGFPWP